MSGLFNQGRFSQGGESSGREFIVINTGGQLSGVPSYTVDSGFPVFIHEQGHLLSRNIKDLELYPAVGGKLELNRGGRIKRAW